MRRSICAGLGLLVLGCDNGPLQVPEPDRGTPRPIVIAENGYARDRFFFYEKPDTTANRYQSYGLNPGLLNAYGQFVPDQLITENQVGNFHVFVDTQDPNTAELQRNYRGFAVEGLAAGLDTTAMRQAYADAGDARRWPPLGDPYVPAHWQPIEPSDVGWVYYEITPWRLVLGFFLKGGSAGSKDVVGVVFDDPRGATVGRVWSPEVRLRLIRHPSQEHGFYQYPTSQYMMRHVYVLGSTNINNLEVRIVNDATGRANSDVPENLPGSTYLHMFGLDDLDDAGQLRPDGKFDFINPNFLDRGEGFLYMPGTRPFSPPREIITQRLKRIAGVDTVLAENDPEKLFSSNEVVSANLYTLPISDPTLPQRQFHIEVGRAVIEPDRQVRLPLDLSRTTWHWASIPLARKTGDPDRDRVQRVPLAFYNPVGEVKRGHLDPTLNNREAGERIPVLELGFNRWRAQQLVDSLDAVGANELWSGVMRVFPGEGLNMRCTNSIEFWLNDYQSDPRQRQGKLHIDFGEMSEDFVLFDDPHDFPDGNKRFNREAMTLNRFRPLTDDLGWDGVRNPDCGTATSLPFGSECYVPERRNSWGQHYLADGTEGNNTYDTEDVNENGIFDTQNRYFTFEVDLADPTFVVIDVNPQYGSDTSIPADLRNYFFGWRKYRIDLDRVILLKVKDHPSDTDPSLRRINFLRLWFEDTPMAAGATSLFQNDLQIYGLALLRDP